jgi:hypothetical protein
MATTRQPSAEELRREIDHERAQLADALDSLRSELDVTPKLRSKLPLLAGAAAGAGFVVAGGVGATIRLLFRRGREGTEKARVGRFTVVRR